MDDWRQAFKLLELLCIVPEWRLHRYTHIELQSFNLCAQCHLYLNFGGKTENKEMRIQREKALNYGSSVKPMEYS